MTLGGFASRTDDPATNLEIYRVENWIYAAINVIARNLAGVPLLLKDRNDEILEKGELIDLMQSPNNEMDGYQLRLGTIINLLATGRCFWWIDREERRMRLWIKPTAYMYIKRDDADRLAYYEYKKDATTIRYEIEDIVHFSLYDPYNINGGLSPIKPLEQSIDLLYYIKRLHKLFFKNGAKMAGVIETEDGPSPEECEKLSARFDKLYGSDNIFSTAIVGGGGKYKSITPPIKDMMFEVLRRAVREDILSVWPMPPFILGILDKANYNNSREGKRVLWEQCIRPIGRLFESAVNMRLTPIFGREIRLVHDFDRVDALQEDKDKKANRLSVLVKSRIFTSNEAREEYNKDPIDGGDELVSAGIIQSISSGSEEKAGIGQGKTTLDRAKAEPASDKLTAYWKKFMKRKEKQSERFARIIRGYFNDQLDRLFDKIESVSNGRRTALAIYITKDDLAPEDADAIFDMAAENIILWETVEAPARAVIREEFAVTASELGIDIGFDVTNPNVIELLENGKNRIVGINNTTYDAVKSILKDAYQRGASIEDIKKELAEAFDQFSQTRAKTIAQNEMGAYINGGSDEAARESGVVKEKQWVSARLPTARASHIAVEDRGPIPMDNKFDVAGYMADYPHDPVLPPSESVWCHCAVLYIT